MNQNIERQIEEASKKYNFYKSGITQVFDAYQKMIEKVKEFAIMDELHITSSRSIPTTLLIEDPRIEIEVKWGGPINALLNSYGDFSPLARINVRIASKKELLYKTTTKTIQNLKLKPEAIINGDDIEVGWSGYEDRMLSSTGVADAIYECWTKGILDCYGVTHSNG